MTQLIARTPPPQPGQRPHWRGPIFLWANVVVLGWLVVAVALLGVRQTLDLPAWLAWHALLLGAVTNAIVIWSEHFVTTWCRVPGPPPRRLALGLAALNTFVVAVLIGVALDVTALIGTGGTGVAAIAAVHTVHLARIHRTAATGRFGYLVAFYIAASASLVAGAVSGAGLALGASDWYPRLWAAHVHLVLLGWVGLTVIGTLFALWPTVIGARITQRSTTYARRATVTLTAGLLVSVAGMLAGSVWLSVLGLVTYAAGLAVAVAGWWARRRLRGPAAWMLAAATAWLGIGVLIDAVRLAAAASTAALPHLVGATVVPILVVGFAAQALVGALTWLLPAILSRKSAEHRALAAVLARGWVVRVGAANVAVPLVAADFPRPLPQLGWALAVLSVAAFVVLAMRVVLPVAVHGAVGGGAMGERSPGTTAGLLVGLIAIVVAATLATAGHQTAPLPTVSGAVSTVEVTLSGMRIRPDSIDVSAGTRLMLRVTNRDGMPHDLRLDDGTRTPLLGQGESFTLDAGTVDGDRQAWCDVAGHRAAGMRMAIRVGGPAAHQMADHPMATSENAAALDLAANPSPGWAPRDALLAPASPGVHRIELRAVGRQLEVAPGRHELRWTFAGTAPGPTLRGRVGDRFEVTLVNDTTMGHGIDFHAGALAPDGPMRTIGPGERLVYRFTAQRAGAWLYHCSTMPMSLHIANGMYGAVIIDPPGLAPVAREYVLVSSQLYLGGPGSDPQMDGIRAGRPDGWMFNGMAAQYDHAPLVAHTGERVRVWVINAGPGDSTAFHVVGSQFDTVYREGAWLLRPADAGGAQVLDLAPAQGGFVELTFPGAGHYPFVDHDMRHAENGAHGVFTVTGPQ